MSDMIGRDFDTLNIITRTDNKDTIKLIEDLLKCYVYKGQNKQFEDDIIDRTCYVLYHHSKSTMSDEEILDIRRNMG